MFARDQKIIGEYARSGPDELNRTLNFVLLTIQQSITDMPLQMASVEREGSESRFLWGMKLPAYEWLSDNRNTVYKLAMDAHEGYGDPEIADAETLQYWASLPGLGLVKGGFVNQLVFGASGCIDSHNQRVFGVKASRFKSSSYKAAPAKTKARMIADYQHLCWDLGGAEFLWDNWCGLAASNNNRTADEISALHVKALSL